MPAAQTRPPAFVYIARSTTIGAGVAPRLSTSAPIRALATVDPKTGGDVHVEAARRRHAEGADLRCRRLRRRPSRGCWRRRCRCWPPGCRWRRRRCRRPRLRPAPTRCRSCVAPARVVAFVPRALRAARPPHRALDDDRHVVGRRQDGRHRGVGQQLRRRGTARRRRRSCGGSTARRCRSWSASCRCRAGRSPAPSPRVVGSGLAIRMNMSKNAPVAPSARNQLSAGAVTPALSWPAPNAWPPVVMYIARSTTIGTVERDRRRDVGRRQRLAADHFVVDRDGVAAVGRDACSSWSAASAAPAAGSAP